MNFAKPFDLREDAEFVKFVARYTNHYPLRKIPGEADCKKLKLNWIVPLFSATSGGHMTLFRIIQGLEDRGHQNIVWFGSPRGGLDPEQTRLAIEKHFLPLTSEIRILTSAVDRVEGDAAIATFWWTSYLVSEMRNIRHRFYFIQDYEPCFYPMGTRYQLAEETYQRNFSCIVAGPWLKEKMHSLGNTSVESFDLGVDHEVYHSDSKVTREKNRIVFYGRQSTPRRMTELGLGVFNRLGFWLKDFVVDFFGEESLEIAPPYPYVDHRTLGKHQLAELYRRGTVGVVFSGTNYSLVSQEMMACGLPVVELDTACNRLVFPKDVITLAPPNVEKLSSAILTLMQDEKKRAQQTHFALEFVRSKRWSDSVDKVEAALKRGLQS